MTPEALQKLLDAEDADGCITLLAGLTEPQRRKLAKTAAACLKLATSPVPDWLIVPATGELNRSPGASQLLRDEFPEAYLHRGKTRAAQVAVIGTAIWTEIKRFGDRCFPPIDDAVAVLRDRRPPWVGEWAEAILGWGQSPRSRRNLADVWPFVRRLVLEGLCDRPTTPLYAQGMVEAIRPHAAGESISDLLRADPGLLDHEVWTLFEIEGLAAIGWETGLAELAAEGRIDRGRLLDATLHALERDDPVAVANWLILMHETLKPTAPERSERVDRFRGLLASHNPSTIVFALKGLAAIDRAGHLASAPLLAAIAPALQARAKGTVESALRLIDRAVGNDPTIAGRAAVVAAEALVHESPVIHEAVASLIERHGNRSDPELVARVQDQLPHVAATQRGRLTAWLGEAKDPLPTIEPASDDRSGWITRAEALDSVLAERAGVLAALAAVRAGGGEIPVAPFGIKDAPRLDPDRKIMPVHDLDSSIALFARMIEKAHDGDDLERLLDGLARLSDQIPADFAARTAPLRARADHLSQAAQHLRQQLSLLALGWIDGKPAGPRYLQSEHGLPLILTRRINAVAGWATHRHAARLLAAPTHRGGWIDPRVLADRLRVRIAGPAPIHPLDLAQALLRLAPDPRPRRVALDSLAGLPGDFAAACRHALGGEGETIGDDPSVWLAAARARDPLGDDPAVAQRFPKLGPDGGQAARLAIAAFDPACLSLYPTSRNLITRDDSFPVPPDNLAVPWLHRSENWGGWQAWWVVQVWPMGRESLFAVVQPWLMGSKLAPEQVEKYRPILEALADPDVPMDPMARLLLATSLVAGSAEVRGLAVDISIAATLDGRLDGPGLGEALGWLAIRELVVTSRLAQALGEAAGGSILAARIVALAVQHLGPALPKPCPLLLGLLRELLAETGEAATLPAFAHWLASLKPAGKLVGLIDDLRTREEDPARAASTRSSAAWEALAGRIERAERWERIRAGSSDELNQTGC